jgi:hypothetical protein
MAGGHGRGNATYIADCTGSVEIRADGSAFLVRCLPGRVDHVSPVSRQKSSNFPYLDMAGTAGGAQPRVHKQKLPTDARMVVLVGGRRASQQWDGG